MKTKSLFIFFLFILLFRVHYSHGQSMLGYSMADIIEFHNCGSYTISYEVTDQGNNYLLIKDDRIHYAYMFDSNSLSIGCIIYPLDDGVTNYFAEYYNRHYTILSPTSWRAYFTNGYADITLHFTPIVHFVLQLHY